MDGSEIVVWLLDVLSEEDVVATFFVTGEYAELYPNITARIVHEGHEVGCHSYTHRNLRKLSRQEKVSELEMCTSILKRVSGVSPKGFRAPYNRIDGEVLELLADMGYSYDASWFDGLGVFYPRREDVADVPISTHFLIPLEDVIWLHYMGVPDAVYFWLLTHKRDSRSSFLFHPHHLKGREDTFRRLLGHFRSKNVTFINHYSEVISQNG